MSRVHIRERLREALSNYPTGVYPGSGDQAIDDLIDAVRTRPDVLTVYGILLTRNGKIEGADVFDKAHPDLGAPGFKTSPLFTCEVTIPQLSQVEARTSKVPPAELLRDRLEQARADLLETARAKLAAPEFDWIGRVTPRGAFYRDADPQRTPSAEPGKIWAEHVQGPVHGLSCVKVPPNCRVVDPRWPHGEVAFYGEPTPVQDLERAARGFARCDDKPSDPQWPTTPEDVAQARASLQRAALDLSIMILTSCAPTRDANLMEGWSDAVETIRRFQRRADYDCNKDARTAHRLKNP